MENILNISLSKIEHLFNLTWLNIINMGWKIISISSEVLVNLYLDNLQLRYSNKKILLPIRDIDVMIFENDRIRVTSKIINSLSSNNVDLIFCNEKGIPTSHVLGINTNSKTHDIFRKQLKWNDEFKNTCWNWISKIKCSNQLRLLELNSNVNVEKWKKIVFCNKTNFLLNNYESQIANLFFHNIFGNNFNRRESNQINSCLDFCYTILTSMMSRTVISKGLNQHISFYHGSAYSQFPLAYDLVEIFRVIVDYFVLQLFINGILSMNGHNLTKNVKNCFLEYLSNVKVLVDGKLQYINNAMDMIVDWIINKNFNEHNIDCIEPLIANKW
ncbi:MAG: type II CRISPR-associated endonuclease Cas1 [Mycoplasma sp.]